MSRFITAAILIKQKEPLIVDQIALPSKLEYGQVLVKVFYSSICGSQIGEIEGVKGEDKFLPHLLGHEGGGIVEAIGPGVTKIKIDDHVVMHWKKGSGIEAQTPKYKWGNKIVNAGLITTFNEYAVLSENRITKVPNNFDLKLAPLFGCAVTTALGVINNDAKVKIGESVVIFGIGGVGLNIAQAAAMVSAYPIIGVDISDEKLALGRKFGLTHVINSQKENLNQQLQIILENAGADVVIETTGNPRVIEQAYELTRPQGRTILVGVPPCDENISIYSLPLHFNKILKGSHGGDANPDEDIPRYLRLWENKKLHLNDLISAEIKIEHINAAIEAMKNGAIAGRVLIKTF